MNKSDNLSDYHVHGNAKDKGILMYFENNFPTDLKSLYHQNVLSYSLNFK